MKKQGIVKATGINFAARTGVSVLGFAQFVLIAKIFGIGSETDAFLIGQTLPMMFFAIGNVVFGYTVLPVFIEYMEKDREGEAWELADVFFTLITTVTLVFSTAAFVLAPYLVRILAPGFEPGTARLTVTIIRLMSPAFLLIGVSSITSTLIMGFRHFTVPALASLFIGTCSVSSILLFSSALGIMAVPAGLMTGLTLQALVLYAFMAKKRALRISFRLRSPGVRQVFRLIGPRLATIVLNRTAWVVDRVLASALGAGIVSALVYADKITHAICLVPPLALTKSMFPDLVKQYAADEREKMRDLLIKAMRFICFLFLPLTVIVLVSGESIITLFFKRGAFDIQAVLRTTTALRYYTLGMLALSMNAVMLGAFFSMQDSMTPLLLGTISFVINVVFDLVFIYFIGFGGIALSSSFAAVVNMTVMYTMLRRKRVFDESTERLAPFLRKVFIATLCMAGVMWAMESFLKGGFVAGHGKGYLAAFFAANVAAGSVVYMLVCMAMRVREYRTALRLFGRACRKGARLAHLSA